MNVLETILILAGIPLAICCVVSLVTLRSKFAGTPRYRPGQSWEYPPVWWSANPAGVRDSHAQQPVQAANSTGNRGGASGHW